MIASGKLRHKVTIEQKLVTDTNSYGEPVTTWSTYAAVWASIEPIQAREFTQYQAVNSDITHVIVVRHLFGVTPAMRIKYGTRVFEILGYMNTKELGVKGEILVKEIPPPVEGMNGADIATLFGAPVVGGEMWTR
jgi:SPP1 family predicted phage head-tail adaptor